MTGVGTIVVALGWVGEIGTAAENSDVLFFGSVRVALTLETFDGSGKVTLKSVS